MLEDSQRQNASRPTAPSDISNISENRSKVALSESNSSDGSDLILNTKTNRTGCITERSNVRALGFRTASDAETVRYVSRYGGKKRETNVLTGEVVARGKGRETRVGVGAIA